MASLITCPHCGVRPKEEFSIRGDASRAARALGHVRKRLGTVNMHSQRQCASV